MNMTTGTTSYTHWYDATGRLRACSEAVDMLSSNPDTYGQRIGFGWCPHTDDEIEDPICVEVPW